MTWRQKGEKAYRKSLLGRVSSDMYSAWHSQEGRPKSSGKFVTAEDHFLAGWKAARIRQERAQQGNRGRLIPLKGISVKGRTVTFVGNPGVLKRYKKKLTALAKRLVK